MKKFIVIIPIILLSIVLSSCILFGGQTGYLEVSNDGSEELTFEIDNSDITIISEKAGTDTIYSQANDRSFTIPKSHSRTMELRWYSVENTISFRLRSAITSTDSGLATFGVKDTYTSQEITVINFDTVKKKISELGWRK